MATYEEDDEWKQLLKSWKLSKYINNFEEEGYDDVSDWGQLIINNGANLSEYGLIDKPGHRNKFIRCYKKWQASLNNNNEDSKDESKEEEKLSVLLPNAIALNKAGFYLVPSIISCSDKYGNKEHYNNFLNKINNNSGQKTIRNKVILVVGQTGAGKSTAINSMINYLYGVKYNDKFRYKLIVETEKKGGQAVSQTDYVNSYQLDSNGIKTVDYGLTIVDTPGFGDTRGVEQDIKIMKNIKLWFEKKLDSLDAVCFVIKASDARLTHAQKYIFQSILNLFGNDIKKNLFVLLTFGDASDPPALAALKLNKIPYTKYFKLNNSAYFKDPLNKSEIDKAVDNAYWNMGNASFKSFFDNVGWSAPVSLTLTRNVLNAREVISEQTMNLNAQLEVALQQTQQIEKRKAIIAANENLINANKNFEWDEDVPDYRKVPSNNNLITTCENPFCPEAKKDGNRTCHRGCSVSDKKNCCMMTNGKCTRCGCPWESHANRSYYFEIYTVKKVRSNEQMRAKYNDASNKKSLAQQAMDDCDKRLKQIEEFTGQCIVDIKDNINKLEKIALNKNVLSTKDYIDKIIQIERKEKKDGYQKRISSLEKIAKETDTIEKIQKGKWSFRDMIGWPW